MLKPKKIKSKKSDSNSPKKSVKFTEKEIELVEDSEKKTNYQKKEVKSNLPSMSKSTKRKSMKTRKSMKVKSSERPSFNAVEDLYQVYDQPLDRWKNRTTHSLDQAHLAIETILDKVGPIIVELDIKKKLSSHVS